MRTALRFLALSSLFALLASTGWADSPAYTITDLDQLGGSISGVSGINNSGQMTGTLGTSSGPRAFSFTDGTFTNLGTLGGQGSYGASINLSGQIVGYSETSSGFIEAFLDNGLTMTPLPIFNGSASYAYAINNSGQITGYGVTPANAIRAFLYDHGTVTNLGTLPGYSESAGYAINAKGQIAGAVDPFGSYSRAFLYSNGAMNDLGTLGGYSIAYDVNFYGQVVGRSVASDNHAYAFLYSDGTMKNLGTLPGTTDSTAWGINDMGQIVGTCEGASGAAFLYSNGTMTNLNSLIPTSAGWQLTQASRINDRGQIVGGGMHNGAYSDFLLTPIRQESYKGDNSVAYQINPAHTGAVSTPDLTPPLVKKWSVDLGHSLSYPLIAEGKVFVIAGDNGSAAVPKACQIYALDATTGRTVWGPVSVLGTYPWAAAAYDSGTVFVVNTDGQLRAFNAATGIVEWSEQLPGQYAFSAPPTALNGILYLSGAGSGGTLYAVNEADGSLLWTAPVRNGDESSPTVTEDGVYVCYGGPQAYKFQFSTGSLLWQHDSGIEGGGGHTSAYDQGRLYTRDSFSGSQQTGEILDAATGLHLAYFDNGPAPAFDNGIGFFLSGPQSSAPGALHAVDTETGAVKWTVDKFYDPLITAPLVVNGIVYVGTASGHLYGFDENNSIQVFSDAVGAPISAPDEINASQPLTGLGAGDGLLVVPAGHLLVAYGEVPTPAFQIDSGGPTAGTYVADTAYSGGTAYSTGATIDTSAVANPAPQAVYRTERYGNFTYTAPNLTPGANYMVRLHFAEIYWTKAGQRLFNVSINGQQVLTNFDVFATAGARNKAIAETFPATADSSGTITLQFTTVRDNAKVSGIEITE